MSSPDPLLDGLDESQRAAVTSDAAPLAILAGAGSGKTRVLTRRIAWQSRTGAVDAGHVLAVTFTRKAAGELVSRLQKLAVSGQVTAGTFHAIALAQLRRRAIEHDRPIPELLARKVRLLAPMLPGRGAEPALAAAEVASEIEWAKARLVRPEGYAQAVAGAGREPPRPASEVAALYDRYEREKRRRRLVDFDDLIWRCADLLEEDEEFRAVQRWRFRHLFVDEFQDANPAQVRLVQAWLGDRVDLCVVGDGDQAIYGFAGADPSYLSAFARHFPGATVLRLASNYRSSPQVCRVAAAALGSRSVSIRTPRPEGPPAVVTAYDDDADEATGVARELRRTRGATQPWSSMAVLYRTNAQSARFEEALRAAAVPFRVRGDGRFLERPEVRVALERLSRAASGAPGDPLARHLDALATEAGTMSEERREHVDALVRLGHEYLAADGGHGSVDGFVAYLTAALRGDDTDDDRDAVQLVTFHRAKGLEWDTVFVTGLEQGLVPISHARTPEQTAEERRLLYVASSRAMRSLHLSWARRRRFGARDMDRKPSPWLAAIEAAVRGTEPPPPAPDPRGHLARARAKAKGAGERRPRKLSPADAALFEALVEWRRELARASGVPAFVIFHDTTLAAVARARPTSRGALLEVPGIGAVKADRHGEALLELIQSAD